MAADAELRADYPKQLSDKEIELVRKRREAVRNAEGPEGQPQNELSSKVAAYQGQVGVGLSGGGIRSATFCLGAFQSLARAGLISRIDYLSTVSGGGYFGSFLGRLFSRGWIAKPSDVGRILCGDAPAEYRRGAEPAPAHASSVFRALRDNGRYLAPRGSGDLLTMLSIALRNWAAVQVVLFTFALTIFVALQWMTMAVPRTAPLATDTRIWWSSWFALLLPIVALWAVPSCWAYWVVKRPLMEQGSPLLRRSDLLVLAASVGALLTGQLSDFERQLAIGIAIVAGATAVWSLIANYRVIALTLAGQGDSQAAVDRGNHGRKLLSSSFRAAMIVSACVAAIALVDSIGATLYLQISTRNVGMWISSIGGAMATLFAAGAAFGRQLLVLFDGDTKKGRPKIPTSVVAWLVAIALLGTWLTVADAASHAVVWRFDPPAAQKDAAFTGVVLSMLVALTIVFGNSRTFLNNSTLHEFYAQRLTRAYLGASNGRRLNESTSRVTDVMPGDDLPADRYWQWPRRQARGTRWTKKMVSWFAKKHDARADAASALDRADFAPLHIVNVTVNETLDGRTGVQQQDRKGLGLAIGPAGFSLGVRHHLVADDKDGFVAPGDGQHKVFEQLAADPETLTLGRWAGISGAAFTTASGSRTSIPIAILATMANVRLGYWWDSGVASSKAGTVSRLLTLPPVYRGLLAEAFARMKGTADRLWNLSDGGHFENLGGYELIRRRLPLIVLVDAEADPDYTFEGLANLVRKARLDFNAEIEFLSRQELDRTRQDPGMKALLPESIFGTLDMLRRGKWSDEPIPDPDGTANRLTVDVDREFCSRAHAAIGKVTYADGEMSWVVYLKATLTGDEPSDVVQYHRGHVDFPQETTADQFFDEAQWESYRRLGEHIADAVLTREVFALAEQTVTI